MQVVFLMASAYDPHYIRKLRIMRSNGLDVAAYGFVRKSGLILGNDEDNISLLPEVQNRNYIKRIKTIYDSISRIIDSHGKKTVYYATTFDIACICKMKGVKYVYGISDIVYGSFPYLVNRAFLGIDRRLIAGSLFSVLTSPGFQNFLKLSRNEKSKCIYIRNKLDSMYSEENRPEALPVKSPLRFGFAGNIRYRTTLDFAGLIGKFYPCHEFVFWGNGYDGILMEVKSLCNKYPNIKYLGKFTNPEDLRRVYDSIDIMVCNYDTRTVNEKLLEPNKLYECIYFNTPMIVSSDTYLAERVLELGCGFVLKNDEESMRGLLDELSLDMVNEKVRNSSFIGASDLQEDYSDFFERLNDTVSG